MIAAAVVIKKDDAKSLLCWSHEHSTNDYNGPDRTIICFGGDKGAVIQKIALMKKESFPLFVVAEHKTKTSKCEAFRKAINQAKRNERQISRQ